MTSIDSAAGGSVTVPAEFLRDLVRRASDLHEVKLVLEIAALAPQPGTPFIRWSDVVDSESTRAVAGLNNPRPAAERMQDALERAINDRFLLRLIVQSSTAQRVWVALATTENRDWMDRLRSSDDAVESAMGIASDDSVTFDRPNIFALYERHIGPLTPLVAEELRDAERAYPMAWIEDAMLSAVDYNKRNWRYVLAILRGWEEAGAPHAITRRDP